MTYAEARYFAALSPTPDPAWEDRMEAIDAALAAVNVAGVLTGVVYAFDGSTRMADALQGLDEVRCALELATMEQED